MAKTLISWILASVVGFLILPNVEVITAQSQCKILLIVLDRSGSITSTDPERYSDSAATLLANIWAPCPVGIIAYSGGTTTSGILDTNNRSNLDTISRFAHTSPAGSTSTGAALQEAYSMLSNYNAPADSVIVHITDGEPNDMSPDEIVQYAVSNFKSRNWHINNIGLASANDSFLHRLSLVTGGLYQRANSPDTITELALNIYNRYQKLSLNTLRGNQIGIDPLARRVILVVGMNKTVNVNITNDKGNLLNNPTKTANDTHYYMADIKNPTPGNYTVQPSDNAQTSAIILIDSPLQAQLEAPNKISTNQNLVITVGLEDREKREQIKPAVNEVKGKVLLKLPDGSTLEEELKLDAASGKLTASLPPDRVKTTSVVSGAIIVITDAIIEWKGATRTTYNTPLNVEVFAYPVLVKSPDTVNTTLKLDGQAKAKQCLNVKFVSVLDNKAIDLSDGNVTAQIKPRTNDAPQLVLCEATVKREADGTYTTSINVENATNLVSGTYYYDLEAVLTGTYNGAPLPATDAPTKVPLTLSVPPKLAATPTPIPPPCSSTQCVPPPCCESTWSFWWWIVLVIAGLLLAVFRFFLPKWPEGRIYNFNGLNGQHPNNRNLPTSALLVDLSTLRPSLVSRLGKPGVLPPSLIGIADDKLQTLADAGVAIFYKKGQTQLTYSYVNLDKEEVTQVVAQNQGLRNRGGISNTIEGDPNRDWQVWIERSGQPYKLPETFLDGDVITVAEKGRIRAKYVYKLPEEVTE